MKGAGYSRFHPHTGYRWVSDESRIEKMRQELLNPRANKVVNNPVIDQTDYFKFQNDVESIISSISTG